MIQYLLLGVLLLTAVIFLSRWFASAQSSTFARVVKWVFVLVCAALTVYLAVTGRALFAILPLALSLLPALLSTRKRPATGPASGGGNVSSIDTPYLHMSLDHDSGAMNGSVVQGAYAGRELAGMSQDEVMDLYATCLAADAESARILETYLDRAYGPGWRQDYEHSGNSGGTADGEARNSGSQRYSMSRDQAYEVLGLEPGASDEAIRQAHRDLLKKLHPDHGGSEYLSAQINQAKDVLIQR